MTGVWDHAAAQLTCDGVQSLWLATADDGSGPFAGESGNDGFTYPTATTGDDGDFVVELHGVHQTAATRILPAQRSPAETEPRWSGCLKPLTAPPATRCTACFSSVLRPSDLRAAHPASL